MIECKHCLSRWESKFKVDICPFCKAKLIVEDPSKMTTVSQVIAYLIQQNGQDFVGGGAFVGHLSDIAPQFAKETRLIRIAVESGAYSALLKAKNRAYTIGVEKQKLCQNYFMGEQWAAQVLQWLVDALENKPTQFSDAPPTPPAPRKVVIRGGPDFVIEGTRLIRYTGRTGHVIVPKGITEIGINAFLWNKAIRTVTLPDSVISIHSEAFHGCTNMESIHLGSSLEHIGSRAFQDCAALKELRMPKTVIQLENYAFSGCASLTEVWLSPSVASHHLGVFHNCTKLKKFSYTD